MSRYGLRERWSPWSYASTSDGDNGEVVHVHIVASSLACHSLSGDGGTSLPLLAQVTSPWRCGNERCKSMSSDGNARSFSGATLHSSIPSVARPLPRADLSFACCS
ncbi:hypothetical protein L3X38_026529 [Prunus dulcis]|uniref:Uncharacterized protein n=1 Tax=Prunus dulcis TaxID=3755 RepID=A0AAD4VMF8_PRUDU|nr:hypothetical protein L3X38_026529 [Prunus dulcis]